MFPTGHTHNQSTRPEAQQDLGSTSSTPATDTPAAKRRRLNPQPLQGAMDASTQGTDASSHASHGSTASLYRTATQGSGQNQETMEAFGRSFVPVSEVEFQMFQNLKQALSFSNTGVADDRKSAARPTTQNQTSTQNQTPELFVSTSQNGLAILRQHVTPFLNISEVKKMRLMSSAIKSTVEAVTKFNLDISTSGEFDRLISDNSTFNLQNVQSLRLRFIPTQPQLQALSRFTNLTSLDLSSNHIRGVGVVALAGALPSLVNLNSLDLSDNAIGSEGARALAGALPSLTNLTSLDLSENGIDSEGARALAGALPSLTNLTSLDLSFNEFEGHYVLVKIAAALSSLPNLILLNMANTQIDAGIAIVLAGVFQYLGNLEMLNLSGNVIGDAGARAIAAALPFLPKLTKLDLQETIIDADGLAALNDAISQLPNPQQLELEYSRAT